MTREETGGDDEGEDQEIGQETGQTAEEAEGKETANARRAGGREDEPGLSGHEPAGETVEARGEGEEAEAEQAKGQEHSGGAGKGGFHFFSSAKVRRPPARMGPYSGPSCGVASGRGGKKMKIARPAPCSALALGLLGFAFWPSPVFPRFAGRSGCCVFALLRPPLLAVGRFSPSPLGGWPFSGLLMVLAFGVAAGVHVGRRGLWAALWVILGPCRRG